MAHILVIAEQRDGTLNRATWEAIVAAQQIGGTITVVVPGGDVSAAANEIAGAGVGEVIALQDPALASYTADGFTHALAAAIEREAPDLVIFAHTYQTRDYAPKLAARLERALITDCVGVKTNDGRVLFVRPVFQGKLNADVAAEGPAPHLATIQLGAFRQDALKKGAPTSVRAIGAEVDPASIRQTAGAPFKEAKQAVDLTQAERIVAVGRGIKGQEHIGLAQELAAAIGAEIAASRPICDAGWLPMDRQVGSSGQTVAPKLYVALGISGAIQHLVGMKGARTIVAINKDSEAPIFEVADYGIAGDLFEVVPAMVAALKS